MMKECYTLWENIKESYCRFTAKYHDPISSPNRPLKCDYNFEYVLDCIE